MAIIEQLGINGTVFVQFFVFILSFVIISQLVFRDFTAALQKRELSTKGTEEIAQESQQKIQQTYQIYETKTRALQTKIQKIFEEVRATASAESEKIISKARTEAQTARDQVKFQIDQDVKTAQSQLNIQVPALSEAIIGKLLPTGKNH